MRLSSKGIEFIHSWEGLKLTAYYDVAGIPTIGYGHTKSVTHDCVRNARTITIEEADRLFKEDVLPTEEAVTDLVKIKIYQNQFDALISLTYNIGIGAFSRSTCLRRLNNNNIKGAADALTWWNKATVDGRKIRIQGLVNRRKAEKELFLQSPETASEIIEDLPLTEKATCYVRKWF